MTRFLQGSGRMLSNGIPVSNPEPAPLPFAWGVLYRHPNPDGSRKKCENCVFWASGIDRCVVHPADVPVEADDMCGFHIFGTPRPEWRELPIDPLDPKFSGLREAGSGVSCANCRYYVPENGAETGLCRAVAKTEDRQPPVPVHGLGWCSRYEGMSIGG